MELSELENIILKNTDLLEDLGGRGRRGYVSTFQLWRVLAKSVKRGKNYDKLYRRHKLALESLLQQKFIEKKSQHEALSDALVKLTPDGVKRLESISKSKSTNPKETKSKRVFWKNPLVVGVGGPLITLFLVFIFYKRTGIDLNNPSVMPNRERPVLPTVTPVIPKPTVVLSPTPTSLLENDEEPEVVGRSKEIDEGGSYLDESTRLVVGVNHVLPRSYVNLSVTFPGQETQGYEEVKSGRVFKFQSEGQSYELLVKEILSNGVVIEVHKLDL